MEAREQLARVIAPKAWLPEAFNAPYGGIYATQREMSLDIASIVLSSLHLTDAAALALMDGEGVVMTKEVSDEHCRELDAGTYLRTGERWGIFRAIHRAMLATSPYTPPSE